MALAAAFITSSAVAELPKAFYVKSGNSYSKYNFGVAGTLQFKDQGNKLVIPGYGETVDMTKVDAITFNAPVSQALTPAQQKQRLIDIAEEVNSKINLHDNAELIRMVDRFAYCCCMSIPEEWEDMLGFDDPGYDENDPHYVMAYASKLRNTLKAMSAVVKGDVSKIRKVKEESLLIFRIEDFNGIYRIVTDDDEDISWDRDDYPCLKWKKIGDADNFQLRFSATDGGTYTAIVDHSPEFTSWTEDETQARLPKQISISLKKDETLLASSVINSEVRQAEYAIDVDLTFKANKLDLFNSLRVTNDRVTDDVTVDINGERISTASAVVNGRHLIDGGLAGDLDKMDGYYDEDSWIEGNPEALFSHFTNAVAKADMLGKLQVYGRAGNVERWHEMLDFDDEVQSWNPFDDGYDADKNAFFNIEGRDAADRTALFFNNYSDIYFCYDGNSELQGYISFDVEGDSYENMRDYRFYWVRLEGEPDEILGEDGDLYGTVVIDGETRYCRFFPEFDVWGYEYFEDLEVPAVEYNTSFDAVPYLTFSDGTRYLFDDEEFFNEESFGLLVDDLNVILDTYYHIVGGK